jgi:hypothetical protein
MNTIKLKKLEDTEEISFNRKKAGGPVKKALFLPFHYNGKKVKLSLCFINKHHAMKTYWEWRYSSTIRPLH